MKPGDFAGFSFLNTRLEPFNFLLFLLPEKQANDKG